MKLYPIILIACTLLMYAIECRVEGHDDQDIRVSGESAANPRTQVELPRFFNFDKFVTLYSKHYANFAEHLNRMRLFMARALVVFLKYVQFSNRIIGYFLAINDKSDWTPEERTKLYQHTHDDMSVNPEQPMVKIESTSSNDGTKIIAISKEEIERTFAEIMEHKSDDMEFSLIANELGRQQQQELVRNRRSIDETTGHRRRELSFVQLMRDPERIRSKVSPKLVASIPSNNPDYEQPQLMSEGVDDDDDEIEPRISAKEAALIYEHSDNFSLDSIKLAFDYQKGDNDESKKGVTDEITGNSTRVYLDYRDSNCVSPVKDQRKCGSCYAFSTMAVYEYLHCKQTGKLVSFSEQFVVDCGYKFELNHCNGGSINKVAEFVNAVGLELSSYYPYRARKAMCPYEDADKLNQMGYTKVKNGKMVVMYLPTMYEDQLVRFLKVKGPLTFSIRTNDEFLDYGGGVHRLHDPTSGTGHAMTLVGHGIEEGEEYWLIRNSHGTSWGEEGYYKLSKDHTDPRALLWVSWIEATFDENRRHELDKVKEKVLKNRNLMERLFNL